MDDRQRGTAKQHWSGTEEDRDWWDRTSQRIWRKSSDDLLGADGASARFNFWPGRKRIRIMGRHRDDD